ncbi:MAG: DUF1456 family protein [Oceanicoccus sp.]
MTNNDILRRIRYIFDLSDSKMIGIFSSADYQVTRAQVSDWLKAEEDLEYKNCTDSQMASFLNGFINQRRGKREGEQPKPENKLNNNLIFKKLTIALNLKSDDVLEVLELAGFKLGKHELSAFFRKPDNKHFRECKDQILRNFLKGVQTKFSEEETIEPNNTFEWKPLADK